MIAASNGMQKLFCSTERLIFSHFSRKNPCMFTAESLAGSTISGCNLDLSNLNFILIICSLWFLDAPNKVIYLTTSSLNGVDWITTTPQHNYHQFFLPAIDSFFGRHLFHISSKGDYGSLCYSTAPRGLWCRYYAVQETSTRATVSFSRRHDALLDYVLADRVKGLWLRLWNFAFTRFCRLSQTAPQLNTK